MIETLKLELDEFDGEIVSLGKATELTTGNWGMWPEMMGEEARSA